VHLAPDRPDVVGQPRRTAGRGTAVTVTSPSSPAKSAALVVPRKTRGEILESFR